jgi:class 3 adenylate cyclase
MEKIKTIGDAYMAASGIPTSREDHAEVALEVAMKIDEEVKKFSSMAGIDIQLRIGLHSGPVVAGVIGLKKTIYDLWGDTVNVAARMEHHGVPGRIQVSRATYKLVKDKFNFINRGKIEVKGKGMMNTYILVGKKVEDNHGSIKLNSMKLSNFDYNQK